MRAWGVSAAAARARGTGNVALRGDGGGRLQSEVRPTWGVTVTSLDFQRGQAVVAPVRKRSTERRWAVSFSRSGTAKARPPLRKCYCMNTFRHKARAEPSTSDCI